MVTEWAGLQPRPQAPPQSAQSTWDSVGRGGRGWDGRFKTQRGVHARDIWSAPSKQRSAPSRGIGVHPRELPLSNSISFCTFLSVGSISMGLLHMMAGWAGGGGLRKPIRKPNKTSIKPAESLHKTTISPATHHPTHQYPHGKPTIELCSNIQDSGTPSGLAQWHKQPRSLATGETGPQ